ncbi:MAG: lipopolysaccharide biosynthesis protein [Pseudomonadota bacterium]
MSLKRHIVGYAPVKLAGALAAFGGVYLFTRLLGPDEYGRYSLLISIMALVHTLTLTWVEAANYRFAAIARAEGRLADHHATVLVLMRRSILAALVLTGLLWWALKDVPGYGAGLAWLGVLLPINTAVQMALEAHRAGQRVTRYVSSYCFKALTGLALGAAIAHWVGWGSAAPLVGLALAASFVALREGRFLWGSARGGHMDAGAPRAWAAYGVPIAFALVLDLILSSADRFMIAAWLGEAALGAYAAGYGVADKTILLLCAWPALAASPLIMGAYETSGAAAAREASRGLINTLLVLGVPAAAGLALVAQPLSEAMIGEALRAQAASIIPWIAFAGLLNGLMIHYASESFQLARKTALRAALVAAPATLNIALNAMLIPALGLMGAVYATVLSYGVGLALLAFVGRRLVAFHWPVETLLKAVAASAAMVPAIALVPNWGSWPQLIIEAAAGAVAFAIAAFALDAGGVRALLPARLRSSEPA